MILDNYKKILGQKIHLNMDRKMGERHPKYNFIYPVNYGYIPNTISEDGEEIDVYILGVFEPVDEFCGICRAIVYRYDDEENKLIVIPDGKNYTVSQMEVLVEFQERFFKHKILTE